MSDLLKNLNHVAALLPKTNVDEAMVSARNAIGGHFPQGNLPRAAVIAILGRVLAEAMADELLGAQVATSADQRANVEAVGQFLTGQFMASVSQRLGFVT